MIHSEQMIPLFLDACPEFQLIWKRHVVLTMNGNKGKASQNSVPEVIAQYLASHVTRGYFKEIPTAFTVIEKLLEDGDEETRIHTENDILNPLQLAAFQARRETAVCQWLGPRTQEVWDVLAVQAAEKKNTEKESSLKCEAGDDHSVSVVLGVMGERVTECYDTLKENRDLSVAFGVMGGGPPGLTYWGWGLGVNFWSLGLLLLLWIGLSLVEKYQRKRLINPDDEGKSDGSKAGEADTSRFMLQRLWKLLDRATGLLLVLGIPVGLSIVTGHRSSLDSSLIDILIVVVGVATVVAVVFRDRLWNREKGE